MKTLGTALLGSAALLTAGLAQAELPSWNYAQLGFISADNSADDDTTGYRLLGSIAFATKWHLQVDWQDGEIEGADTLGDTDFDGYSVVLGAHPAINANTQAIFDIKYFDIDYEPGDPSEDDFDLTGLGLGFGVRSNLTDQVELIAQGWWITGEEDGPGSNDDFTDVAVQFGGRYNWTQNFSTGVLFTINDTFAGGTDSLNLDARWAF